MKKPLIALLPLLLLVGCTSEPNVSWQQDNRITIADTRIELASNLWINQMPTLGESQQDNLHGALYLSSDRDLPASLTVSELTIKQGEQEWKIDGDLLELRTHSENKWEIAFVWQANFDPEKNVDLLVELDNHGKREWLVERNITIDKVF
ncbi:TPA: hypothetical protein RQJ57_001513 [Vibrio vulnificus]|uniref:hypothetical protein n=1 Tax=Vibrio vulnificus TaxID=672 RepID=UPI00072011B0|nr:hypothetical protein [Vibrio vulnificus]ALM71885.1 hypothetical protein FORC9_2368 [Vibrio vulnificus]ANH62314.1 hypothetical protein FORC16_0431 [Vibrio vulnificus]HDY7509313.1 hypothetical protein [Vibrio vulnificus]